MTMAASETMRAFAVVCRTRGWGFRCLNRKDVRGDYFDTLQQLYLRSLESTPGAYTRYLETLTALNWPISLRDLLAEAPAIPLADLCEWLFNGKLHADLRQPLDLELSIKGFQTSSALE